MRILIVEDEKKVAAFIKKGLEEETYAVDIASYGEEGLHLGEQNPYDLIILDLMLPSMDGMEVCRNLRQDSDVPIIMLTARGKEPDRILGLELGADDYVVKPFSPGELVARARAVLRRVNGEASQDETITSGNIQLDLASHSCTVDEQPIELSRTQFAILASFMQNAGRVLSRYQILESAFEGDYSGYERTIDVHIRRLRKKIEKNPANPEHILTVFGVGYKFE